MFWKINAKRQNGVCSLPSAFKTSSNDICEVPRRFVAALSKPSSRTDQKYFFLLLLLFFFFFIKKKDFKGGWVWESCFFIAGVKGPVKDNSAKDSDWMTDKSGWSGTQLALTRGSDELKRT